MTRYLLDTNIFSDLVRNPRGRIFGRIAEAGASNVCTSIVVAAELRFGAAKKDSTALSTQIEMILAAIPVMPLDMPADRIYGDIRARLESKGMPIGTNDLLIAAQALALNCIMVTDNEREFARIGGLAIENWLRG